MLTCFLPNQNRNNEYLGSTGYIDGIRSINIPHKIMYGRDSWLRPFITLKIKHEKNNPYYKQKQYIIVLFQRYADDKTTWAHSTVGGVDILSGCGHFIRKGIIYDEHIKYNMYNLLNNKKFIYRNDYRSPYKIQTIDDIYLI